MTAQSDMATAIDIRNTVPRALVRQADRYGAKPLVRFPRDGAALSYAELVDHAESGSTRLRRDHGLQAGAVAAIYLGNSADYVKAWFVSLFAGLVDVSINHEFRKSLLLFGLSTVEARIVFTDGKGVANLADPEVSGYLERLDLLVLAGAYERSEIEHLLSDIEHPPITITLDQLTAPGPWAHVWTEIEATSAALIRFTSGTTGPAKGILQSHLHVLGKSAVHDRILEFSDEDILYSPFPLHHNLASINGLIGTLQAGGTMVSVPRFSASAFWKDARDCGATLCHLLQSIAPLVSAQPPCATDRQHRVRYLWTGGPDPDFERRFNIVWVQTYALGEIGAVSFKRGALRGDTGAGRPLPEMEVRIAGPLDEPLAVGVQGEITVRPRHPHRVMLAYHNNLAATMRAFRNLWFHTGDAGFLSESGELHFVGRLGDTIRRRGVNISSEQIEDELRRHPNVLDCAVIAVAAGHGDQEIQACVLWNNAPREPAGAFAELADFLADRLSRDYIPRLFESVEDLPRTNTGKVQKALLRNRERFGPTWDRQERTWINSETASSPDSTI